MDTTTTNAGSSWAFELGYHLGQALFFLVVVLLLCWLLHRLRRRS